MARRFLLALSIWVAMVMCAMPLAASTLELQAAISPQIWERGVDKQTYSVQERQRLAQSFLNYWASFEDRLPRLSPVEKDWVEREMNSGSRERASAIMARREYGLWSLFRDVSSCRRAYAELIPDIGGNPKLEALRWARSVGCYINEDSLSYKLVLAGLAPDARSDGPFVTQMFSIWAHIILRNVLGSVLDEPNFR